jgi:hypothetical protein
MQFPIDKKDLRVIDSDELLKVYNWIAEELNTRAWVKIPIKKIEITEYQFNDRLGIRFKE